MKVLMILESEFPYDERVEKEALTLIKEGYDVEILAFSLSAKSSSAIYKGIKVYSPFLPKLIYKFYPAFCILPFYRWYRMWQLHKMAPSTSYNFIHVHDLPMSKMGYLLKKKFNAKLICDQHEFYSNWIGRTAHMKSFAGRIINFLSKWEKYERKYLSLADLVITVSDNLREIYIRLHGIDENKIISVPNTPLQKDIEVASADLGLKEKYKNRFVLFYGGMIDILRGIDLMINALPLIREKIPEVLVVLAGRIRRGCDPLGMAKSLGVEDQVEYVGFLKPEELRAYIAESSMCFATLPADSIEINNTIITKIYQYAALSKPILVGKAQMMKDFVNKYDLGLAANEKDPADIARVVCEIKEKLSSFTFKVPEQIMFWEYTSVILPEMYGKI